MPDTEAEIQATMRSQEFRWGVKDFRTKQDSRAKAGRGFSDVNYDRGKQWAEKAPPDMEWITNGQLNLEAIAIYKKANIV